MSKQYLSIHTIEDAHPTDIYGLAVTPAHLLSASGSSSIVVHSTGDPTFPQVQTLSGCHPLGCHHICTSRNATYAASIGFGGEVKIWACTQSGQWREDVHFVPVKQDSDGAQASSAQSTANNAIATPSKGRAVKPEVWAISLSADGQYLVGTYVDGRVGVWDLIAEGGVKKIRGWETRGKFGMCVDISADGRWTATGHEDGGIFVYDNTAGKLAHVLVGLTKPVRAVAFSPGSTRLAAAGDAGVIALYDVQHGEQVGQLTGHGSWILSLDWSATGEHLLSGAFDGKVKVWSVEAQACVATHAETEQALWSVRWTAKIGRSEAFATAGTARALVFYREATGG